MKNNFDEKMYGINTIKKYYPETIEKIQSMTKVPIGVELEDDKIILIR